MDQINIIQDLNPWWLILSILVALGLSGLLYHGYRKGLSWQRQGLRGLRFLMLFLVFLLLLNPVLKYVQNEVEQPVAVIALDNSSSMALTADSAQMARLKEQIKALKTQLQNKHLRVTLHGLKGPLSADSLQFDQNTTNLSSMLRSISSTYEGQNLAQVVLISDGVVNRGIAPEYRNYGFPVTTVGIGDTVPKPDAYIRDLSYNRISYQGNKFPLRVYVQQNGFEGQRATVSILSGGKVIQTKPLTYGPDATEQSVRFELQAGKPGIQSYQVRLSYKEGEFLKSNNEKTFFIEVLEGKKQILIAGAAPHPDLKALRRILEKDDNYEVDLYLPLLKEAKLKPSYDLIVLHQLPNIRRAGHEVLQRYPAEGTPRFYIAGLQSNYSQLNNMQEVVQFMPREGKLDAVSASFNQDFSRFTVEGEQLSVLQNFPPMKVPYGEVKLQGKGEAILYQQIGNLVTDKPLLAVAPTTPKQGVLAGNGIWLWWQNEYAQTQDQETTATLFKKTMQYLTAVEDKRPFRFYPIQNEFTENEHVRFEAQVFNSIYEPIYNQAIEVSVKNDSGKTFAYDFVNSPLNNRLDAGTLPAGLYTYTASTTISGKKHRASGQFSIQAISLEAVNTTANFQQLRQLAQSTGGTFFGFEEWAKLSDHLTQNPPKSIIRSFENIRDFINLRWLFFVILALAILEWSGRKWLGGI